MWKDKNIGAVLLSEFFYYQKVGLYCDVRLIPGNDKPRNNDVISGSPVMAHSLVLATASVKMKHLLESVERFDGLYSLVFPNVGQEELLEAGVSITL